MRFRRNRRPIRPASTSKVWLSSILVVAPTVAIVSIAILLMHQKVPTRIQITTSSTVLTFVIGKSEQRKLLEGMRCSSVSVEGFESITMSPRRVRPSSVSADAKRSILPWKEMSSPVEIAPARVDLQPSFTIEARGDSSFLALDAIWVSTGDMVFLELISHSPIELDYRIIGNRAAPTLLARGEHHIHTSHCKIQGVPADLIGDEYTDFDIVLGTPADAVTFSAPHGMYLGVTTTDSDSGGTSILDAPLPVDSVSLIYQGDDGNPKSTNTRDVALVYPGYAGKHPSMVASTDIMHIGGLQSFFVEQLRIDDSSFEFVLSGVARELSAAGTGQMTDLRLSKFDTLWYDQRYLVLFAITCWAITTTFTIRDKIRSLKARQ